MNLDLSQAPHIQSGLSYKRIMWYVVIALLPAMIISIYIFGIKAIFLVLVSVISCVIIETIIKRIFFKDESFDASPVITGVLLAFNVPSNLPVWELITGCFVAIAIAKMTFGGLGKNPFNPAVVGRIFLLASFPVEMTTWPKPFTNTLSITDAVTGPTILSSIREGFLNGHSLREISATFHPILIYLQERLVVL